MAYHLGQAIETGPNGITERDCITCGHCQRIVDIPPTRDIPGGICKMCMRPICMTCYAKAECVPWEKSIERMEARDKARRSYGV